jgi:glutaredoxin
MLKKIFITFLVIGLGLAAAYLLPRKASSGPFLSNDPYIIIYGRTNCSICQDYQQRLDNQDIAYTFKDIGDTNVQDELYPKMKKAGLNSGYFQIPVIDVNGKVSIRPELRDVINGYRQPPPKCVSKQDKRFCEWLPKIDLKKFTEVKVPQDPLKICGINLIRGEFCAIVGEKIVRKGDKIGSYEVVEIKPGSVEFRDADGKSVIKQYT